MNWEAWKRFGLIWFALILPIIILLLAMATGAGVLWMFMLLVWICAGIMLVFLPSTAETANQ
jgi:hypothetical protein